MRIDNKINRSETYWPTQKSEKFESGTCGLDETEALYSAVKHAGCNPNVNYKKCTLVKIDLFFQYTRISE